MHARILAGATASLLLFVACGGAQVPGGSCNSPGLVCKDPSAALECHGGRWALLPCRGPAGCMASGSEILCDASADVAGDGCALAEEGLGMCSIDGLATLECRDSVLFKTNTCSSCAVSGGLVICQP